MGKMVESQFLCHQSEGGKSFFNGLIGGNVSYNNSMQDMAVLVEAEQVNTII